MNSPAHWSSRLWASRGSHKTINDMVADMHLRCWHDPERAATYQRLWGPVPVEGKFAIDDHLAAEMIRQKAAEDARYTELATLDLSAIVKALHVLHRRYGLKRRG